jgi:hypothetical protein
VEKLGEGEYGEVKKGKLIKRDHKGKRHTVNIYYSFFFTPFLERIQIHIDIHKTCIIKNIFII